MNMLFAEQRVLESHRGLIPLPRTANLFVTTLELAAVDEDELGRQHLHRRTAQHMEQPVAGKHAIYASLFRVCMLPHSGLHFSAMVMTS